MVIEGAKAPLLGSRFRDAMHFALTLHERQLRKGSEIPYSSHLLGVSCIVIDVGGTEDEAIAALLHDAAEDQGGVSTLDRIRALYGENVGDMVAHLSDTFEEKKPEWRPRKEQYHARLRACSNKSVLLVSAADKLHNLRATLTDYTEIKDALWPRFNAPGGSEDVVWNYTELLKIYEAADGDPRLEKILKPMRNSLTELRTSVEAQGSAVAS